MQQLARKCLLVVARAWFTATFIGTVVTAGVLCRLIHLCVFLSKRRREQLSSQAAGLCFRMIFTLNPQISIEHASEHEPAWDELFADPNSQPMVLINHTSPLDSIFYSACVPMQQIQNLRTLAKSSLFKIPLFGHVLTACGHFPVFFASDKPDAPLALTSTGSFSVNKEAQEQVSKNIADYLANGGGLSMFPEGQLNRNSCRTMQSFRRGSFQLARDKRLVIWGFLHTGIDAIWPVGDQFGGNPGKIRFKLFKLAIPSHVHSLEDLGHFVTHVEKLMQLELDLMHAIDAHDAKAIQEQLALFTAEVKATAHGDVALEHELTEALRM